MALIAWYKLDGDAKNSVGNGMNATLNGGSYVLGKYGQGYYSNSTTDNISANITELINVFSNNFSVGFWYKMDTVDANSKFLFSFGSSENNALLHIGTRASGSLFFAFYANDYETGYTLPAGEWLHITCVGNKSEMRQKVYINGNFWGERAVATWLSPTANQLTIGNLYNTNPARGVLDDIKIFSHLLNESEIKRLAGEQKSLVAHYKLDGNGNDETGRYNATLNSITFNTGIFKQGLDFNATGKVDFGNLNLGKIFSISFWAFTRDVSYPRTNLGMQKSNGRVYDGSNSGWDIGHGYQSNGFDIAVSDGTNFKRGVLVFDAGYRPSEYINKWVHTVFIFDSDSKIVKAYVNGIKQTNEFNFSNVTGSIENTGTVKMGDLYGWRLNGIYDDIRFYSYALDESKIKELALPKILHYKFDSDYEEATENLISLSNSDAQLERSGNQYPFYSVNITAAVQARWSPSNNIITLSYEGKKSLTSGGYPSGYIYFGDWSWGMSTGSITTTQWTFNTSTATMPNPTGKTIYFAVYHMTSGSSGISYSRNHQVEMKDHATAFVNGTRTGAIVKDHSLAENHGTIALATTPKWSKGDFSYGKMIFNQQFINLPNSLGYTSELSAFGWFKSNGTPGDTFHIMMGGQELEISIHSSGYLRAGIMINGARQVHDYGSGLTDGTWKFIGFTYDGNIKRAYLNGVEIGQNTLGGPLTSASFSNRRIGVFGTSTNYFANADMDDIQVFSKALTSDQVMNLYKGNKQIYYNKDLTSSIITMEPNKGSMEF